LSGIDVYITALGPACVAKLVAECAAARHVEYKLSEAARQVTSAIGMFTSYMTHVVMAWLRGLGGQIVRKLDRLICTRVPSQGGSGWCVGWLPFVFSSFVASAGLLHSLASDRLKIKLSDPISVDECTSLHQQVLMHQSSQQHVCRFQLVELANVPKEASDMPCKHAYPERYGLAAGFALGFWKYGQAGDLSSVHRNTNVHHTSVPV
jgi:hypothetical protein